MIEFLFPDLAVDDVRDIDSELLIKRGIKGLILDIDNTLVATRIKKPDDKTFEWVNKIRESGMDVCIVSNSSKKRVGEFAEGLTDNTLHRASKPSKKGFLSAAKIMGTKPEETAVIGDQIFTDVYGGNKSGMFTILVKPIEKQEFWFVRFKRLLEKPVLRRYHKRKR